MLELQFSEARFLIAGVTRNGEASLEGEISRITECFKGALEVKWIVVESDSNDDTVGVLDRLSKSVNLEYISLGGLRQKFPKRTERIAYCRNKYLEYAERHEIRDKYDYLVVADLDGVNSLLSESAVLSCWRSPFDWDACFANQKGPYYDIWALRHEFLSPNDCWSCRDFLVGTGLNKATADYRAVWSRMVTIDESLSPIEVESAFGGLGIYKFRLLNGLRYVGVDRDGVEFCEHVSLHSQLKARGAKLYIFPSLLNGGWNEHSANVRLRVRLFTSMKYCLFNLISSVVGADSVKIIYDFSRGIKEWMFRSS